MHRKTPLIRCDFVTGDVEHYALKHDRSKNKNMDINHPWCFGALFSTMR
jgi:hypothetical protein